MAVVWTIEEKCKRCYCCIRECPAKAIKVENGQAKVIESRCVACGHCVQVCSQNAKAVLRGVANVVAFLKEKPTIAMLAPSFAAAYNDLSPEQIIGALRSAGFSKVVEVAFGADLVNQAYKKLVGQIIDSDGAGKKPIIASSCPALTTYIKKYAPELLPNLAPIVSPMIAMGRVVRKLYGKETRVVFIGPCSAKKVEAAQEETKDAVDEVLTFNELIDLWDILCIDPFHSEKSELDAPHAYAGGIYPISGGLLHSAGLSANMMDAEMIVSEGKENFLKLVESLLNNQVNATFLDVLFCEGCINGPFMDHGVNYFARKQKIVRFAEKEKHDSDKSIWEKNIQEFRDIDVSVAFHADVVETIDVQEVEILKILQSIEKYEKSDELNCGACGYSTCRNYAVAIYQGLAETDMCLPFLVDKKERMQRQLQDSLDALADTQEQLIQQEKLASIGRLAAGVAHEVNNPLGSIVLFAHLVKKKLANDDPSREDMAFIIDEAKRCQGIISDLRNFSRQGRLILKKQSIAALIDKMVKAVRQLPQFKNIDIRVYINPDLPDVILDGNQLYQVFLNLACNAADAMPDGGALIIRVYCHDDRLKIYFEDTGCGIEKENLQKLFTPFFTTKSMGKSTGLGLAIAYGIIKMHEGSINVLRSVIGEGTTFVIELPARREVQTEKEVEYDDSTAH